MTQSTPPTERRERMLRTFEARLDVPMIALSFVWLLLIIYELTWGATPLVAWSSLAIWGLFIVEFAVRFVMAPEKRAFLKTNWFSVIALAAPALRLFAIFKLLRLTRSLALVRVVAAANRSTHAIRRALGRRGLGYAIATTLVVLFLGAAAQYFFEGGAHSNGGFDTYGDALWWTAMMLTTMGSGSWPQTVEGRVLCVLLAVYGFVMFGYITATIAAYFLDKPQSKTAAAHAVAELRNEIAQLRADLAAARKE